MEAAEAVEAEEEEAEASASAVEGASAASPGTALSGPRRSCTWFSLLLLLFRPLTMMTLMLMTMTMTTETTTTTFTLLRGRSQLRRKAKEEKETLPASGSTSTPLPRGRASKGRSLGPPTRQAGACCSSGTSARTGRPACRGRCLRFPLAKSGTTFAVERKKKAF